MAKKSLRVYFVQHGPERLTGILMRRWDAFFDVAPPAAFGVSEDDVKAQLLGMLRERQLGNKEPLERYLWDEQFGVRRVTVDVYPQSLVNKQPVVGARKIPLKLAYAWTRLRGGATGDGDSDGATRRDKRADGAAGDGAGDEGGPFKVMLPRFGWWITLESLDNAQVALQGAISGALLGEEPAWLYDFRHDGEERVEAWLPDMLRRDSLVDPDAGDDGADATPPTLGTVAEELVDRVARRKVALPVGPDAIGERELALLDRRPLPSILLVGPSGVGKSTWVRQLARHIAMRRRDKARRRRGERQPRIWATSGDRIIAGMVYLGQWQQRCLELIKELGDEGDFLYVDRLTSILAQHNDGASIAEMLLPPLESGELALIAECTEQELERCRQRLPNLLSHFSVVRLEPTAPPRVPELLRIGLRRLAPHLELRPDALKRLVHYLAVFERHSAFPGKAFRFADWLAQRELARARLPASSASTAASASTSAGGGEAGDDSAGDAASASGVDAAAAADAPGASGAPTRSLGPDDVSRAFARYSGLPLELIADETLVSRADIAARLGERVVAQPHACELAASVLSRFKAGINDPERPVGSLLFTGPTGVGKTELAKQLARYMFGDAARMVRVDMSEYLAPGSAARLLAVGDGQKSLAEAVRKQPLSLVLLDEIEKAHAEVFDLLLGVLGEGRLSDSLGRLVDFRMTLIVMTSNLGAGQARSVGFGDGASTDFVGHVRRFFRPELFNRLDHVVPFNALARGDVERIVELELQKAAARAGLRRRALRLTVEPEARVLLAELGFDPLYGARPLKRVIEERVMAPIALKLAARPDLSGCALWVLAPGSKFAERLDAAERRAAIQLVH